MKVFDILTFHLTPKIWSLAPEAWNLVPGICVPGTCVSYFLLNCRVKEQPVILHSESLRFCQSSFLLLKIFNKHLWRTLFSKPQKGSWDSPKHEVLDIMVYYIHGRICHIWRSKLRGQFSKNLVLWIYEFLFNSGDRISQEGKVMEALKIKNVKYDRNF